MAKPKKSKKRKSTRSPAERAEYAAARAELASAEWTFHPALDVHGRSCFRLYANGAATEKFCYSPERAAELIATKYTVPPKRKTKTAANPRRGAHGVAFRTRDGRIVRF